MSIGWIIFIIATVGWHIGMYGMFKKAGIAAWKAFVPFYNTWCMVEKMPLKKYWFFLQLVPIMGQFITIWITIKFVEHFGRFGVGHHAATTFLPFLYFPYLGFSKDERYAGNTVVNNYKKSAAREWIDAAAFAVVAATLIRTFAFEAYTIPTPSMEKTLLVNDFLFVSKFNYGTRLPNTPIAMPFVHHTMPFVPVKSYSEAIKIPYTRWFAKDVNRDDVVVFNFPVNDTLINDDAAGFGSQTTYYEAIRALGGRERVWNEFEDKIITRPVDKRENFIKRCVAIGGDTLQVINGNVVVSGKKQAMFPQAQRYYLIIAPAKKYSLSQTELQDINNSSNYMNEVAQNFSRAIATKIEPELKSFGLAPRISQDDVKPLDLEKLIKSNVCDTFLVNITNDERKALKVSAGYQVLDYVADFKKDNNSFPSQSLFPYYRDTSRHWSVDNFGPIWVPKRGANIELTPDNLIRYDRCIGVYEGNKLEVQNGKVLINGVAATSYTFKYNYYWMMGDNRHNSLDSRYWGFVPEDHVVGEASLIWFSWEKGPRWKRLFNTIK
jgi:signal peptidase I